MKLTPLDVRCAAENVIKMFADEGFSYEEAERVLEEVNNTIKKHALITADNLITRD